MLAFLDPMKRGWKPAGPFNLFKSDVFAWLAFLDPMKRGWKRESVVGTAQQCVAALPSLTR